MSTVETEFLFEMHAKLNPPIDVGPTPNGHRMILLAPSGHFEGPGLRGEVMGMSGGDWALLRPDGSFVLDVRVCLKTHDGAVIYMTYSGRLVAPDAGTLQQALDFTKPDDKNGGAAYYFRTNPVFETSSPAYAWLNGVVAIGKGRTGGGGVTYEVFKVK